MPDRLRSFKGGKPPPKTSTCVSCDDEGRIWLGHDDHGRLHYRFCWCEIGQERKQRYCEETRCKEPAHA